MDRQDAARQSPRAPRETGEALGVLRFRNGDELRVGWVTGEVGPLSDDPFVSLWLWRRGYEGDGVKWPDRSRGFRIHPREVRPLLDAFKLADARAAAWLRQTRPCGQRSAAFKPF